MKRETVPLESELKLWVSAPTRPASDAGAYKDDYAIDREALRKRLAPCLVHMLDAAYSAFVLERLEECNVRDCVALHDCWYVPVGIDFDPAMIAKERAEAEAANRAAALAGSSWRVRSIGKNRPSSAETALRVAMLVAGRDWLLSLGPFYSRLIHYLGDDRDYGQDVHRWRNQWQARVDAERWPVFAAKPSDLSRWHGPAEVVPPI